MQAYEFRHIVSFEETSLVGNVYYTNHLRWQGRCREMFLRDHAPGIVTEFSQGFALATVSVSCEYLAELSAFDEIIIRMRLGALRQNRITMSFEYWRVSGGSNELVARGEQEVACMQKERDKMSPVPVPQALRDAFRPYQEGSDLG